jgi:predicted GIY-YIG superfamily endonuclease
MEFTKPWYLYTLSHKCNEFYVGISRNPVIRYSMHKGDTQPTSHYIYWIAERGELNELSLNIVNLFPTLGCARAGEETLIKYFVSKKHKLLNVEFNTPENTIITCLSDRMANHRHPVPKHISEAVHNYHRINMLNHESASKFNKQRYAHRKN